MKRVIDLIISFIGSVLATLLFLYRSDVPIYWQAFKIESLLGVLVIAIIILILYVLRMSAKTKEKLKDTFDISRPVKKLTTDDFHITNYDKFYIERESDKEIENLLKERKYAFITGIPMLGKTRMAYESVKKLKGFYLLKPQYEKIDIQKLKLPFFKKKIALFLDDLDKYVGKFNLDDLVRKLKEKAQDFVVIATCRSGKEFDQVFARKEMEMLLTQCEKGKTEPRLLKQMEQSGLAETVGKRLKEIASNGTPGSITINLDQMKKRYKELGHERFILKCLKLLREGNIFLWKENVVQEVSNGIFNLNITRIQWDDYIKSLLSNGFIKKSSDRIFISHDVYLDDRFLDDYSPSQEDFENLREKLSDLKDIGNLNNLGLSFHAKRNFKEAQLCYSKAIEINGDYIDVHGNLGNLFSDLKKYNEAEKEYRKVLEIDANDALAHYNLGILLKELKRYEETEKEYKEALRINPDDALAHNNLGLLLHEFKRYYQEAEKEYKEALRLNPDSALAHYNLGNLLSELKRYPEAEKEYKEALRINPDDALAHYNLGNLLSELKRYPEAEKEYKEALRINPDDALAHNNLGILLKESKRYPEAEKEYKEALRINPDYAGAHNNLGNLLKELKRYQEAEKEYKEALRINPDYADAHYNLGILLYELKRYPEAEKEYKEALRINPDDAVAHYNLGILLKELNRYEEAEKEYKEALRINPDFAEAHYNLGILLKELNRYEEAEKEYKEALRINPDDALAHYNLGVLLYELKRYDEAEKEYREALRINPDYAEAHGNLGILLKNLNRKDEAKKEFEIARNLFRKQGREEDAKKAEGFLKDL